MKKVLFLIHDLGQGGAEKVLVNLVNNMDDSKFDVTVMTLFDYGVNRQFLSSKVKYKTWCSKMIPGNSHLMKLISPEKLHRLIIKEHYDIEIAYLEGPCARVISGCTDNSTKLISWIHSEQKTSREAALSFRNEEEAEKCYNRFQKIVCVSEKVRKSFINSLKIKTSVEVYYNTNESEKILRLASENIEENNFNKNEIKLIGVGKLHENKGFDRLLKIVKQLRNENYAIHLYILGCGPMKNQLEQYIQNNNLNEIVTLLGYQTNPYKYVARCDLFVCSSHAEGFSTAATEALIVGTPVCTVQVAGMTEMLGEHNEYGIVTENNDISLYQGIKEILDSPKLLTYYKTQAEIRGKSFSTENTVMAVEEMLIALLEKEYE